MIDRKRTLNEPIGGNGKLWTSRRSSITEPSGRPISQADLVVDADKEENACKDTYHSPHGGPSLMATILVWIIR